MIPLKYALKELQSMNLDINNFVKNCISGKLSYGSGHSETPSEDMIIQLLRYDKLENNKRRLIIDSCKETYKDILDNFFDKQSDEDYQSNLVRLTRTIDMAQPPELENQTRQLFDKALSLDSVLDENLGASMRAFTAYVNKSDIKLIEDKILTNKNICAYGFNAMLDINDNPDKIYGYLKEIYQRRYNEDWPVNCFFLTRRASRILNDNNLPVRILKDLKENNLINWEKLSSDLQNRTWTKKWLKQLVN